MTNYSTMTNEALYTAAQEALQTLEGVMGEVVERVPTTFPANEVAEKLQWAQWLLQQQYANHAALQNFAQWVPGLAPMMGSK